MAWLSRTDSEFCCWSAGLIWGRGKAILFHSASFHGVFHFWLRFACLVYTATQDGCWGIIRWTGLPSRLKPFLLTCLLVSVSWSGYVHWTNGKRHNLLSWATPHWFHWVLCSILTEDSFEIRRGSTVATFSEFCPRCKADCLLLSESKCVRMKSQTNSLKYNDN